ncbi:MAG: hypothetical protein WBG95_14270 [Sulfitobacter sp.]
MKALDTALDRALDTALIAAHEADAHETLVDLYMRAAARAGDIDTACFHLTHAYIFALELGDARAVDLRDQLVAHGRETND